LAGGPYEARVTGYYFDASFDYRRFTTTNDIDGADWALLRIDRPLGRTLGHLDVRNLTGQGREHALATPLYHGGYPSATGGHQAGHLGCRMVRVFNDNTFAHECDTTHGDSGSSLMMREGERYYVIGVDSNFRDVPHQPEMNIAVSAAGFAPYVDDFVAGRIGS